MGRNDRGEVASLTWQVIRVHWVDRERRREMWNRSYQCCKLQYIQHCGAICITGAQRSEVFTWVNKTLAINKAVQRTLISIILLRVISLLNMITQMTYFSHYCCSLTWHRKTLFHTILCVNIYSCVRRLQ